MTILEWKSNSSLFEFAFTPEIFSLVLMMSFTVVSRKISTPLSFACSARNLYVFLTLRTAAFGISSLIDAVFFGEQNLYERIGL